MKPNLFIVAFKSKASWFKSAANPVMPDYAKHALECAHRFSGCNVIALTDLEEEGWSDIQPYCKDVHAIEKTLSEAFTQSGNDPNLEWDSIYRRPGAVFRWLVIRDYLKKHNLTGPVFNIDWDVLVLSDLGEHFNKLGYGSRDYGVCYDNRSGHNISSAPYFVNQIDCIEVFSEFLIMLSKHAAPGLRHFTVGDMGLWRHLQSWGCYNVMDCGHEVDNALFDKSIALGLETYVDDGGHNKKVVPVNGELHFIRRHGGGLVKAVSLHCFCSWKTKTHQIMDAIRTKSSDHDAISHS